MNDVSTNFFITMLKNKRVHCRLLKITIIPYEIRHHSQYLEPLRAY